MMMMVMMMMMMITELLVLEKCQRVDYFLLHIFPSFIMCLNMVE